MDGALISQTHDQLFAELTEAKRWFDSIGINTQNNRFATIYSNVDFMRQQWGKPTFEDGARDHGIPEIRISLLDAASFVTVHRELAKLNSSQLPRRRLREVS